MRLLRHHAEVAPQPKLHPPCDGRPFDRGNHRLVELEPRRTERPAGNFPAVLPPSRDRNIELVERMIGIERRDVFEIPARAERAARPVEHRDRRVLCGVELQEGGSQLIRAVRVHRVAGFRPVVNDGPHRAAFLDPHRHDRLPFVNSNIVKNSNNVRKNVKCARQRHGQGAEIGPAAGGERPEAIADPGCGPQDLRSRGARRRVAARDRERCGLYAGRALFRSPGK